MREFASFSHRGSSGPVSHEGRYRHRWKEGDRTGASFPVSSEASQMKGTNWGKRHRRDEMKTNENGNPRVIARRMESRARRWYQAAILFFVLGHTAATCLGQIGQFEGTISSPTLSQQLEKGNRKGGVDGVASLHSRFELLPAPGQCRTPDRSTATRNGYRPWLS